MESPPLSTWKEHSSDPNEDHLRSMRAEAIRRARSNDYINDRAEEICRLAKGKRVLDVGVVAHTADAWKSSAWLHGRISKAAASCVGVDILPEQVNILKAEGFDVRCADITLEPLPETFELIVCGEIIEHIENPGALFANAARMLEPGGHLVLSTPNPWYINCILKNIHSTTMLLESVDHVAWYDPATLYELSSRHQLELERFTGVFVTETYSLSAAALFRLAPLLTKLGFKYELFSKTLLYDFVRAN
jgi:2-polyprenyl-3-methyl-5-hydroxy-6-metoxy-1,4-benzoquinol methylase